MERQAKWAADKPGVADWLLSYQSDTEAFFGRLAKARELTQRAVQSARQNDQKETAAGWQMNGALREAEFGNTARAHEQTMAVLASVPDAGAPAALALARAGDSARAQKLADEQQKRLRSTPSSSTIGCRPFVRPSKSIAIIPPRPSSFLRSRSA